MDTVEYTNCASWLHKHCPDETHQYSQIHYADGTITVQCVFCGASYVAMETFDAWEGEE